MKRVEAIAGLVVLAGAVGSLAVAHAASLNVASQAVTAYRTCTISGTTAATSAVADASVRQLTPATNFGTQTSNDISTILVTNRRMYVRFSLAGCSPAIPASATVRLATLRLFATALPITCRTVDIFRVTASWTETGITWNNQPFGTTLNNPPAGSAVDTFAAGTPGGCENRTTNTYITGADVTADVAAFVAGTATNNGWMLRDDAEGAVTLATVTFTAKDAGSAPQAPQLVVTWLAGP